jgi:hypothetical protein
MSVDISSKNYGFAIGDSMVIESLKLQTVGKPMFTRLWELGKLSPLEAELLRNECLDIQYKVITSSGKEFYAELLKLIADSIGSGEDIIVHGIYQDDFEYNVSLQKFWEKPVIHQEIIINAIAPGGMTTAKWQVVNMGLTDDYNTNVKYSPILEARVIVGLKCGIYLKDLGKKSLWNDLRGMMIKLSTYKFILTFDKTDIILNKENYEELIRKNFENERN